MTEGSKVYPHVIPDIDQWPIYKLLDDRKNLVEEIDGFTYHRLLKLHSDDLEDVIAKTIYAERIRIREEPWKVDPPNERVFWKKISRKLLGKPDQQLSEGEAQAKAQSLLRTIIHRYTEEIVGTFRIPTFLFARKFLTVFFNRLLNTAAARNMKRIFGTRYKVYERLLTKGEVEKLRSLMTKGTVIIVPTHSSNLDSMLIGYALDTIVGLPSFSYGAGLNLYNTGYTAYFMNRLGAYRVDRRKKNPIYLETLKGMSTLSIQRGTNSLFFPGGTRSRSGALEDKLKMGLLGTAVEAQRANLQKGKEEKVFIVPLILSYHFVLEAKYLIEQHLSAIGKERYVRSRDEFYSFRKLLKFGWTFFSQPSEITLSFGKPLDVMGNFVDSEGKSFDRFGREVSLRDYFVSEGELTENLQRENEYTIMLADRLVERYHKENIVLTSHIVAYAAFNILRRQNSHLDLFGVLRLPPDDFIFPLELMLDMVEQLKNILIEMNKQGKIKLSNQVYFDTLELLQDGVRNLGVYHIEKPLLFVKKATLVSQDFKLLFFYHNRLENYKLNKQFVWSDVKDKMEMEVA
ncbi:MAG: 1-acyl-sn-glycerol-3-phosphate acyltransferase [Bacteroidetes bacterium]|nr:1-acyl-sn-glycerol-3-phosphate acyltransferase [Bacteroidota bacterium]